MGSGSKTFHGTRCSACCRHQRAHGEPEAGGRQTPDGLREEEESGAQPFARTIAHPKHADERQALQGKQPYYRVSLKGKKRGGRGGRGLRHPGPTLPKETFTSHPQLPLLVLWSSVGQAGETESREALDPIPALLQQLNDSQAVACLL